jgi:glycosyltransferase involved in cell wall biosynthesis
MAAASRARILQVAPRFLPYMGGVEVHVAEISPRLAEAGFDVSILTTDVSGQLPLVDDHEGIAVHRVPAYPAGRDYYLAPGLSRAIERAGPFDLIHIHSYQTLVAPLAMLAARRLNVPYVLTFHSGGHSSRIREALRGVQRGVLRPLLLGAERLIAVSQFEIDHFSSLLRVPTDRFELIENGGRLPVIPLAVRPDPERPLILSIGRLERYKGHHRLIAALPHVLEQVPTARLRIAGLGPYEGELWRLARGLNVADHVEIGPVEPTDRQAMAVLIGQASVVALLSEYEAQAIAVMEALSLHRPVVVCHAAGLMEFADRGFARGVAQGAGAPEVAQALVDQIREPLAPPAISMPSWESCASRLGDLYDRLVDRAGKAA